MSLTVLHCSPLCVSRSVSACGHECDCSEGVYGWKRSRGGGFSPGDPEVGDGAHASYLARQDTERHGAEPPHCQVLGGAQVGGGETTGSPVPELCGGSCDLLASGQLSVDGEQELGL